MKTKSFILGAVACLFVTVVGAACIIQAKQNNSRKEKSETDASVDSQFVESTTTKNIVEKDNETGSELTIVSSIMNVYEEHPYYELVVQNTTNRTFKKITYRLGEMVKEQYNLAPGEKFQTIAYDEIKDIIVLSVDYGNVNLFEEETSMKVSYEENKLIGTITNNGVRELYPSDIILFVEYAEGVITQVDIPYAGCFNPGLVIKPGETFEFSYDLEKGYKLLKDKGVVFIYSDLEFKDHTMQEFRDVL